MSYPLPGIAELADAPFDEIIDVRSPAEFAEDHLPGALSLPVLSNAERARVGTLYKQEAPFAARKTGAAIIARNIAAHLDSHFAAKARDYCPLIYCWRGGQRSGAMGIILKQVGWRAETLEGGYRSWRRAVVRLLYDTQIAAPVVLLDGNTGTAKTDLLQRIARQGGQVLDLEGLAHHRGSLFGARPGGQPAQKAFESGLAQAIARLDPARPVIVEAESSRVGERNLPPGLWKAMMGAPRIHVRAPLQARAAYLVETYRDIAESAGFAARIGRLQPYHSRDTIARWREMHTRGDWQTLAGELMREHYDPRYEKQRRRAAGVSEQVVAMPDLSEDSRQAAAGQSLEMARQLTASAAAIGPPASPRRP